MNYSILTRKDNSFTKCKDDVSYYYEKEKHIEVEEYQTENRYYLSRPKSDHEFCQIDFSLDDCYFFKTIHGLKMEMIYTVNDQTQFIVIDVYADNLESLISHHLTKKAFLIYRPKQSPVSENKLYRLLFTLPTKMRYKDVYRAKRGIIEALKKDFRVELGSYIFAPNRRYKGGTLEYTR